MESESELDIDTIASWFRDRGFGMKLTGQDGDLVWVELTQLTSGDVVAPRFGRGSTALAAAQRAMERYQQEQD